MFFKINFILITFLFLLTITLTVLSFYRNIFSFNNFFYFNFIYLPIIITTFLQIFIFKNQDCVFSFEYKLNLKPLYIKLFSIKISYLESNFIFVISLISFFANILSFIYLNDDKKKKKFFIFLNWFSISMFFFILQNCIFLFLLSWELLGLTSFFLINHYENTKSIKSAMSAFLFNRLSDIPIIIIAFSFIYFNNSKIQNIESDLLLKTVVVYSMVLASFFKSAIVFFKWLPDSMEAPLPASALIHSATLVSAGIYLTIKYNFFFKSTLLLIFLQILTIFISLLFAVIASFQTDIKKILAYSTIANCSFIYNLIFSKNIELALFYFQIHGIFKSLVFISVGFSILINKHKQDIREWNNLSNISNYFNCLVLIPLACLTSIQITPVYKFKSNFIINYN